MDWQALLLGLFGGGLMAGVAQVISARSTAKKSDVEALRGIIAELRDENVRLSQRVDELEKENEILRKKLGIREDGRTTKGLALDH